MINFSKSLRKNRGASPKFGHMLLELGFICYDFPPKFYLIPEYLGTFLLSWSWTPTRNFCASPKSDISSFFGGQPPHPHLYHFESFPCMFDGFLSGETPCTPIVLFLQQEIDVYYQYEDRVFGVPNYHAKGNYYYISLLTSPN